jgi:25S rRNA (adenine2142-N1)-methyltransferase
MAGKKIGKSLSSGRPPNVTKPRASMSSQATRKLIRTHHTLNKKLETAKSKGNDAEAVELEAQIEKLGGLKAYQQASIQGQSIDRGGDSSVVLMKWLESTSDALSKNEPKLRLLEVGALSTSNVCSRSGHFDVQRIDLNSQGDGILQQDFMERPLPKSGAEKFDIISLSLVLNYVPDATGRGEMLKRTCQFLDTRHRIDRDASIQAVFPALFLVLPAPCVTNARYMDEGRLGEIMNSLGYVLLQRKQTLKLVYYLWQLQGVPNEAKAKTKTKTKAKFLKKEVNPGPTRNNFSIVLTHSRT